MSASGGLNLALSEAAVALIRHAAVDIPGATGSSGPTRRILTNAMGVSTDPEIWLRETAVVRLVSVIEAYVDAVSMHRMDTLVDSRESLVSLLLQDFELASSGSWQDRHDAYLYYHAVSLRSLSGWDAVKAGIEVRNCLLHGLGNLTAKQRGQTKLASSVKSIDVAIGANRMHLGLSTVQKVGAGCDRFVRCLDGRMSLPA